MARTMPEVERIARQRPSVLVDHPLFVSNLALAQTGPGAKLRKASFSDLSPAANVLATAGPVG